jgi:hypothetical protein
VLFGLWREMYPSRRDGGVCGCCFGKDGEDIGGADTSAMVSAIGREKAWCTILCTITHMSGCKGKC